MTTGLEWMSIANVPMSSSNESNPRTDVRRQTTISISRQLRPSSDTIESLSIRGILSTMEMYGM